MEREGRVRKLFHSFVFLVLKLAVPHGLTSTSRNIRVCNGRYVMN